MYSCSMTDNFSCVKLLSIMEEKMHKFLEGVGGLTFSKETFYLIRNESYTNTSPVTLLQNGKCLVCTISS